MQEEDLRRDASQKLWENPELAKHSCAFNFARMHSFQNPLAASEVDVFSLIATAALMHVGLLKFANPRKNSLRSSFPNLVVET